MSLKLITPPAALAVPLAEVKAQLRIDDTAQDSYLTTLIGAATQVAEHETGRRFITQDWEAVYDVFPAYAVNLGLPPVQQVLSVKYVDPEGVEQTLATTAYVLDADQTSHHVLPADAWPATMDTANAVRVRFRTGYGLTSADVPANARVWITLAAMQLYQGCGADGMEALRMNPLLDDLRVYR